MSKNRPHKWAKEIKAWADGATIEYRNASVSSKWIHLTSPGWVEDSVTEYRIKPEETVLYACQYTTPSGSGISALCSCLEDIKDLWHRDLRAAAWLKFTFINGIVTGMEVIS